MEKGRITIPQEVRARLGLKKGDEVKFLLGDHPSSPSSPFVLWLKRDEA
ncbi:MAG: AbrB/MazE/SpoVT family DNA-binding domain-containing protein [Candidatus Bathyarchaeia archaeon]